MVSPVHPPFSAQQTLTTPSPRPVALNFYFYEGLKAHFITPDDSPANKSLRTLLCGAAAGSVAQTLTYPFDVLRRKMQVAGMDGFSPAYTGALDAMIKITKAEGWWNGM